MSRDIHEWTAKIVAARYGQTRNHGAKKKWTTTYDARY
jgi:hypothetical protein